MTSPTKAAVLLAAMSAMASSVVTPMPAASFGWKSPPTKSGNNRPNNCAARRAKNKAASKSRAQQRRKAKKG